ncbi:MAG: gliding motility-associated ABC transporter ATP-binding subunit GldA [Flavobacteriaceae bacterium]|nr:MAG: gliding motility-associated ABC transporter ATP-binding subunit GldA [Flavobacteriaceae bacterium]
MFVNVKNIVKKYGNQFALNDVSFSLKKGEVVGFLGPNGAGKSSMMKIITGFMEATSGEVFIDEVKMTSTTTEIKKQIGYLPEHNPLYLEMYVREYLLFLANIHKLTKKDVEKAIEDVGLKPEAAKKIKQLSKGYRQRVGLAAAIMHNPSVLILDEPTTGLDPNQLVEIRSLIKQLSKDKVVLLSTHIMQEVEALCDRVIIINKGEVVADESLLVLTEQQVQLLEVEFDRPISMEEIHQLKYLKEANNFSEFSWVLTFDTSLDMRASVFDFAHDKGFKILQLTSKDKSLESLFSALTT